MAGPRDVDGPLEAARRSELVPPGAPLVVMLSGGADSTCLLDVAVRLGARVHALHVDHGLRPAESAEDERHCRELCARLEVPLSVEQVRLPDTGNLQAAGRAARYGLAERLGADLGCDHATAHTLSDQAETVVYRLATSPGRRALLGMAPRRGRLVRPLLESSRAETHAYCRARGLGWREDPSNLDLRFARARVRAQVMPALTELGPAAERTIAATTRLLREEEEVLEAAVREVLPAGARAIGSAELAERPAALRRLVLRRLAEEASAGELLLSAEQSERILELASHRGGSSSLDVGRGVRAVIEYGTVRFTRDPVANPPAPTALPVPGSVVFGEWEVEARPASPEELRVAPSLEQEALLDGDALGDASLVRAWRAGDRLRPVGLGGTKSLQDLFTDAKVPSALRGSLPLVESGGRIAWVAGLAVDERFRAVAGSRRAVALTARRRTEGPNGGGDGEGGPTLARDE